MTETRRRGKEKERRRGIINKKSDWNIVREEGMKENDDEGKGRTINEKKEKRNLLLILRKLQILAILELYIQILRIFFIM